MMRQFLSYLLIAMILSCSTLAMAARLIHRDLFGEQDPAIAVIWALLGLLYLFVIEWMSWRQNVKKMVSG